MTPNKQYYFSENEEIMIDEVFITKNKKKSI